MQRATEHKVNRESELVTLAIKGDERAFSLLCEAIYPKLVRYALSLCHDKELALDAVQDVLLKMSQSLRKLSSPAGFNAWCLQALRWRVLDLIRKGSSRKKYESAAHREPGKRVNLESEWQQGSEIADDGAQSQSKSANESAVGRAIQNLPFAERDAVYLFYLLELGTADISQIQGVPIGTVKSRLHRARQELKRKLQREEN